MQETVDDLLKKIERYHKGFQFTLQYNQMPEKIKINMMKLMRLAEKRGLIESISIGAGWNEDGTFDGFQCETFKRL